MMHAAFLWVLLRVREAIRNVFGRWSMLASLRAASRFQYIMTQILLR